jgi:hypothetical protein
LGTPSTLVPKVTPNRWVVLHRSAILRKILILNRIRQSIRMWSTSRKGGRGLFRISIHTINITTVSDAGSVNIGNTVNAVQKQQVMRETQPDTQPKRPGEPPALEPTVPAPSPPGAPGGGAPPAPPDSVAPGDPGKGRSPSSGNRSSASLAHLPQLPKLPRPVSGYHHPVVVISPSV